MSSTGFGPAVLALDEAREVEKIAARMVEIVGRTLRRRGVVVAVSGGIDSSTCLGLAVRAFGREKVKALLLPERESSRASIELGTVVCRTFGVEPTIIDITTTLEAIGCYRDRDDAIREVFPSYGPGWKNKVAISGGTDRGVNFFKLVVQDPAGTLSQARLPLSPYLRIVAAQNHKQRIRKTLEYHWADRLNYAVVGTPNRLEYDQGFFVKNGDGAADVKPIAHLYKTQVYALARHLGLPEQVTSVRPTTDTYSLAQGQDEFFFALPYEQMDLALWALNHGVSAADLAPVIGVTPAQAELVYRDIHSKREGTRPLHLRPQLVEPVLELPHTKD